MYMYSTCHVYTCTVHAQCTSSLYNHRYYHELHKLVVMAMIAFPSYQVLLI